MTLCLQAKPRLPCDGRVGQRSSPAQAGTGGPESLSHCVLDTEMTRPDDTFTIVFYKARFCVFWFYVN